MAKKKTGSKARKSGVNRALNAFAIANEQLEKAEAAPNRRYQEQSDSDDGGSGSDAGSEDSWAAAMVDSDSGSDIDSDDAFGEADEQLFEDYAFRGSTGTGKTKKKEAKKGKNKGMEVDLSEEESAGEEAEESDEDGEGYMDLSEMLDRKTPESSDAEDESDNEPTPKKAGKRKSTGDTDDEDGMRLLAGESGSEESGFESGSDDDEDMSDAEDVEEDPLKLQAFQSLITSMPSGDRPSKRPRIDDPNEKRAPGEYNLALPSDSMKLSVSDLLPSVTDPKLKKSLKLLMDDGPSNDKKGGVPRKLSAPLAKRQQDKLDRQAAYTETKTELKKWVDTVKHNREADRLQFPLANAPDAPVPAPRKLAAQTKPMNDFEAAIAGILSQSGVSSEKQIAEFEELKTNQMSVEDVQERTAELRRQRDLMFREEAKAKRLKKIKSKAYRRIKKKERMKEAAAIEDAIAEERGGEVDPEDEEKRARLRAEERMSLRHKQSRWAKGVRDSGRGGWDLDARSGAEEMALRHEELKKRIEGKTFNSDGETDSEESSDDEFDEEGEAERQRLLRELEELKNNERNGKGSKLMNMKFMQNAEAARKKENEVTADDLRRDLERMDKQHASDEESEDGDDESEADDLEATGRMSFKPNKKPTKPPKKKVDRNEFEAPPGSSDEEDAAEDDDDVVINTVTPSATRKNPFSTPSTTISSTGSKHHTFDRPAPVTEEPANPWLVDDGNGNIARPKQKGLQQGKIESKSAKANIKLSKARQSALGLAADNNDDEHYDDADGDNANVVIINPNSTLKVAARTGIDSEDERDDAVDDDSAINLIPANSKGQDSQREMIKKAFAGDNVVREFAKEKRRIQEEDDDKTIDETLPGWGHWSGAGLSSKQKKFNAKRRRITKTIEGVKKDKRKDAKLERVIINEKTDKKAAKFQVANIPHPFENQAQYDRSMRLPLGPEWTTKSTFQDATAPRVLIKQGRVIEAISAPFK